MITNKANRNFYISAVKPVVIACVMYACFHMSISAAEFSGDAHSVNKAAALNCLQEASEFFTEGNWKQALFQAQLGKAYDSSLADFPYIEAVCGEKLNYPLLDRRLRAEEACADGMVWRLYDGDAAKILCADLNVRTHRYNTALRVISSIRFSSADSDLIKASALYGLRKYGQAQKIIETSLTRWALDPRFAKLFFYQERRKKTTQESLRLARLILSKLYVWQEQAPDLLVLASPFENSSRETIRRLKIYRNMYMSSAESYNAETLFTRTYSTLLCLHYGIIDENTAVNEFLNMKIVCRQPIFDQEIIVGAMYADHLIELCRRIGTASLREQIKKVLKNYSGVVLDDADKDGIVNTKIFYQNGRPAVAEFDPYQEGYPDFTVLCSFGIPEKIYGKKNEYTLTYDKYPAIKSVQKNGINYTLRPLALRWTPVNLSELNLKLFSKHEKADAFFVLQLKAKTGHIRDEQLLYSSMYYEMPYEPLLNGSKKIFLDKGSAVSALTTAGGQVYSMANYRNGILAKEKFDKDGDDYFETVAEYDSAGNLSAVSVDLNKNNVYEYAEKYLRNGDVIKTWDSNEDRIVEVTHYDYETGDSATEWIHPKTKQRIRIICSSGVPRKLIAGGETRSILKESKYPIYWLERIPDASGKIALELVNRLNSGPFGISSGIFDFNGLEIYAVQSGGYIFAEVIKHYFEAETEAADE